MSKKQDLNKKETNKINTKNKQKGWENWLKEKQQK